MKTLFQLDDAPEIQTEFGFNLNEPVAIQTEFAQTTFSDQTAAIPSISGPAAAI
jgi:hypothetical protein